VKTLEVWRQSLPDNPKLGYGDVYQLCVDDVVIQSGKISTSPVPFQPSTKLAWWKVYGFIADGRYNWKCIDHNWGNRFGKCLQIQDGKSVASVNTLHGRNTLSGLFVHSGGRASVNKNWRGSKGCLTVSPNHWQTFINRFDIGETGYLVITSKINVSEDVWRN
jgi:hypothetical protein